MRSVDGIGRPRSTPLGGDPLESKKRSLQAQVFPIIRIRNHWPKCRSASLPLRLTKSESPNMRTTSWGPGVAWNADTQPGHIKHGWGLSMRFLRTALGKAKNSRADTGGARECVWMGCDKRYSSSAVTSGKCQREGIAYSVLYTMNIFQVLSCNLCVCSLIVFLNDHLSELIIPCRIPSFFHLDCLFLHCYV